MMTIQNRILKKLLNVYDGVEKYCLEKDEESFGECLQKEITECANNTGNKEAVLMQYEMHVRSYLDSHLITFNISVVGIMISLIVLSKMKISDYLTGVIAVIICVMAILLIHNHIKERKLSEILFAINRINGKFLESCSEIPDTN